MDRFLRIPYRSGRRPGVRVGMLLAVLACLASHSPGTAQEPPDTLKVDSLAAADTLRPDSLALGDSLGPPRLGPRADSASADTIFYNLPLMDRGGPAGWAQGIWAWDLEAIQASGALTLAELLADVPGVIPLLAGDHGTPVGVTAFGVGGGRVRVLRDGFEVLPLEGGVADLARVGLAGISLVRLERSAGELIIRMEGLEHDDGRPYSVVEAATGDQGNNFFRGTFADPVALGGSVGIALERSDARGARGNEPGSVTGSWLRYQLHRGDAAGLAVDFRRVGSQTEAADFASSVVRTDLTVRGRARLATGVTGEAYWGKSTHKVEDEGVAYEREGGSRSQMGVRAALERGGLFADGAYRSFGGEGLPSGRLDLSAGGDHPQVGGLTAELDRASWPGATTSARRVRGWTRPVLGLSVFGSWESGTFGARSFPVLAPLPEDSLGQAPAAPDPSVSEPVFRVTERSATRVGAQWVWRDVAVSGARLEMEADSLLPLGIEPDRGEPALGGGTRTGWEIWGRFPTPVEGLRLEGSLQQWDEPWSYLPRRTYTGALVFHRTYLATGNLEWWWTLGVRGHDAMTVRRVVGQEFDEQGEVVGPELASVPFYQNWYARLQIRIVSMRIFIGWENFTVRRNLQNYPDRLLPITRAVYGIRWTLWN